MLPQVEAEVVLCVGKDEPPCGLKPPAVTEEPGRMVVVGVHSATAAFHRDLIQADLSEQSVCWQPS